MANISWETTTKSGQKEEEVFSGLFRVVLSLSFDGQASSTAFQSSFHCGGPWSVGQGRMLAPEVLLGDGVVIVFWKSGLILSEEWIIFSVKSEWVKFKKYFLYRRVEWDSISPLLWLLRRRTVRRATASVKNLAELRRRSRDLKQGLLLDLARKDSCRFINVRDCLWWFGDWLTGSHLMSEECDSSRRLRSSLFVLFVRDLVECWSPNLSELCRTTEQG